ncbi:hypothetical protein EI94DRAFT_1212607 [Lactarius quietus]|nr:hypothetical protein EI94DRAFT_1212607 [Lactarius quietus]
MAVINGVLIYRFILRNPLSPTLPPINVINSDAENDTPDDIKRRAPTNSNDSDECTPLSADLDVGSFDGEGMSPLIIWKYWRKKGMILGRCVEMWDTFTEIINEGVSRNTKVDEDYVHTDFENHEP